MHVHAFVCLCYIHTFDYMSRGVVSCGGGMACGLLRSIVGMEVRFLWWGVVGCGVVWCGVVCGVVWFGVMWCDVEWCGVVWCDVV